MTLELTVIISMVSVAFSVFFGLKNSKRADTRDVEERVERDTRINMKLDEIGRNINDMRYDLSSIKQDMKSMDKRLVIVEQSTETLHKRVDVMEDKLKV